MSDHTKRSGSFMMKTAELWAEASYAKRKKVGAVISKDGRIISTGYNGTLPGEDNECEIDGITKPTVMHAEANAISFCAKNGLATNNCSLHVTMSPCVECAKLIIAAGITEVYYSERYRITDGIELLQQLGVHVERI